MSARVALRAAGLSRFTASEQAHLYSPEKLSTVLFHNNPKNVFLLCERKRIQPPKELLREGTENWRFSATTELEAEPVAINRCQQKHARIWAWTCCRACCWAVAEPVAEPEAVAEPSLPLSWDKPETEIAGDLFAHGQQTHRADSLAKYKNSGPLNDIIPLNDRLLYLKVLFSDNRELYDSTLSRLQSFDRLQQAEDYLGTHFPSWELSSPAVQNFLSQLKHVF